MRCPKPYQDYSYDDKRSFRDWTGCYFPDVDWSGKVIYASVFSNETPDAHIFPDDMKGVTFIKCNLDNVFIPDGNTVIDCWQKRFKIQNDLNDWLVDENNNPIKPTDYKIFEKFNLPVPSPDKIPISKVSQRIDLIAEAKK